MDERIVTAVMLVLPLILPTYTAWAHPNWKGVLLGGVTLWLFLLLAIAFLIGRYGSGGPGGIGLALWMVGGWFPSLVYCLFVAGIRSALRQGKS
jgi:hypothetical protein